MIEKTEKTILAVGGSVVKECYGELREIIDRKAVDVLVHSGGSIFHDFQMSTELLYGTAAGKSYSIDELLDNWELNAPASRLVWDWIFNQKAPENTITSHCEKWGIEVMLFTVLGGDFFMLQQDDWSSLTSLCYKNFCELVEIMKGPFHFLNVCSSTIHPEVFLKALAKAKPEKGTFRTTVVDFLKMYRPLTRLHYGKYCLINVKEFFKMWLEEGLEEAIAKSPEAR